ncbi:MAG: Tetratricopeptide repeat [Gemmatimonadetes bacterium]|nr:Tetratricopeptide repeat [Gemmatimonadota bacterium]
MALNPSRPDIAGARGAALLDEGHPDQAVPFLETFLREQRDSRLPAALLSVAYAELGRGDEAARMAGPAGGSGECNERCNILFGRSMTLLGRFRDAQGFFREAARLAPNDPEALTRLAISLIPTGSSAEAARMLEAVLAANPGYEPAVHAIAKLRE